MNEPPELDDEMLSECCGMPALGEIYDDNSGMCAGCRDHAMFSSEEMEHEREQAMALAKVESALNRNHAEALADGVIQPHTLL